ncbi:MAG: endonuclease domain-containing protein [Candidatus Komeilibacteria bacterium]|nr:endonuclease domain-containing protein [Candidatus Komeilibacteria bacterium]
MVSRLINAARTLRKNQTPQERKLWYHLRGRNFLGHKFRRQHPIGAYIVDFCCEEKKIIIELDGGHHADTHQHRNDHLRDDVLRSEGFRVLRVWNNEIDRNLDGVVEKIKQLLE